MKIKICSIGECMLELVNVKNHIYNQSIAGDTLNFSSYLDKRLFEVSYLTAIGTSEISNITYNYFKKKKINTGLVNRLSSHEIGLYLIRNDNSGEKIFYYWRDNSASKFFFNNQDIKFFLNQLQKFQYIYLTGISLCLFESKKFINFIKILKILKKKQIKIIFDLNIRIKRWSKKKLILYFSKTLPLVDILFASGEDLKCLIDKNTINTFEDILNKNNISHGIYRKNAKFNYTYYNDKRYIIKNKIINKVIDTSGAGDGYNAAYLSSYIKYKDVQKALIAASKIGAKIITKKGAIVDVR